MTKYRTLSWMAGLLWFGLGLLTVAHNGPFFDEATQITAGLRTFEGHGLDDGYLVWFGGSLFWPLLAGVGYQLGGLAGSRAVALCLGATALVCAVRASSNLFGWRTALWTALVLVLNGPLLALARLAVYDILALACSAVALWAVTELPGSDRRYVVIAALGVAGAALAKYPTILMALPLCALLVALRGHKARMDLAILWLIVATTLVAYFVPFRYQLAEAPAWQAANKPTFGVSLPMIAYAAAYWSLIPVVLGIVGWAVGPARRSVAAALFSSLAVWPLFHLLSYTPVSLNKTLVFGFVYSAPLAGRALAWLWEHRRARWGLVPLVLSLALLGLVQWRQLDSAWPDLRPSAQYLAEHVEPNDLLLVDESWPYIMYLYGEGRIESPWNIYDVYRVSNGQSPIGLCDYDWFVHVSGSYAWPSFVTQSIRDCDAYTPVRTDEALVTGLGTDLRFHVYPVEAHIWRAEEP